MMLRKVVSCMVLLLLAAVAISARPPGSVLASADVQPVETLDGTRVYRLTVNLSRPLPPEAVVEYLVLSASGAVAGGGSFAVRPDMMAADSDAVSVLTGFGGMDMSPGHRVVAEVVDSSQRSAKPATESQITDTCTVFCDRCSDKAASLCTNGVATYSCSCSGDSRSCNYTCFSGGKPPV